MLRCVRWLQPLRYGAVRVRATGMFISSFSHMSNRINGRKQYCQILNVRQMGAVSLASEKDFHDIANKTLDDLLERLEAVEESLNNCDISSAQGVVNINLGEKGCWVINKQTPNRQLWWSSPLSGPRRYEYHGNGLADGWHCVKGGREESSLLVDLRNELLQVTGVDIANL